MKTHGILWAGVSLMILALIPELKAQTAEEHASHHAQAPGPGLNDTLKSSKAPLPANSSAMGITTPMGAGMGAGMSEMMQGMGKAPAKELYPALMQSPDPTPEKRQELKELALKQIIQGDEILRLSAQKLAGATRNFNTQGIQEAVVEIHYGRILLESGLDGQQAVNENKDPRITAMRWFKGEMNLSPLVERFPSGIAGLFWFHLITMLLLTGFAGTMIWMYFYKMKRAGLLVQKLTGKDIALSFLPVNGILKTPALNQANENPTTHAADLAPSKPNSWTGTLVVAKIFDETPHVKTYRLLNPGGGALPFNFLPGQFITVTILPKGIPVKRSYTIASSPTHREYCEITVKDEEKGNVSHYMHTQVHIGELMQFTAPSGKFTFTETHADSAVFIGGGVGVTPMMSAVRYLTDHSWKGEIYFFFACKDESSIIFREEILYLQKRYLNLHVFFVLSQQQGELAYPYIPGYLTKEILSAHVPDLITRMIHICGPKPMMDAVKMMLEELNVPRKRVMEEAFAGLPRIEQVSLQPFSTEGVQTAQAKDPLVSTQEEKTDVVTFLKSTKTAVLTPDKTVLEASEEAGVNIDYSCRVGTCGICKIPLISGKVTMAVQDALTEEDKAHHIILACQAKAIEDISVDA